MFLILRKYHIPSDSIETVLSAMNTAAEMIPLIRKTPKKIQYLFFLDTKKRPMLSMIPARENRKRTIQSAEHMKRVNAWVESRKF